MLSIFRFLSDDAYMLILWINCITKIMYTFYSNSQIFEGQNWSIVDINLQKLWDNIVKIIQVISFCFHINTFLHYFGNPT